MANGIEIWGGFECSIVRIGDSYRNQIEETGHADRIDDLDRLNDLGIKTIRYPILWEDLTARKYDWSWHDERLERIRSLGMKPIAGLIHHGSGPIHTSMVDEGFAEGLAKHAEAVAERYPWIDMYTPVNEPLTTARFSALYGHWYPHARNRRIFLQALVNECKATKLSMQAIRKINPRAQLIQTEDLGRIFSTPELAEQAEMENQRRWLSIDMLCGLINEDHPWWNLFEPHRKEMYEFLEQPCRPDVFGINHYLTSDRYLDHRYHEYPPSEVGGNGKVKYADVAAVRAHINPKEWGPAARLQEAWDRYGLPIAITEVHNGSTPDQQLRWLELMYQAAVTLKSNGGDVRAITAWSVVGAVDWVSLLRHNEGLYEPGLFDCRYDPPLLTELGLAYRELIETGCITCTEPAWWTQADRFHIPVRKA